LSSEPPEAAEAGPAAEPMAIESWSDPAADVVVLLEEEVATIAATAVAAAERDEEAVASSAAVKSDILSMEGSGCGRVSDQGWWLPLHADESSDGGLEARMKSDLVARREGRARRTELGWALTDAKEHQRVVTALGVLEPRMGMQKSQCRSVGEGGRILDKAERQTPKATEAARLNERIRPPFRS